MPFGHINFSVFLIINFCREQLQQSYRKGKDVVNVNLLINVHNSTLVIRIFRYHVG